MQNHIPDQETTCKYRYSIMLLQGAKRIKSKFLLFRVFSRIYQAMPSNSFRRECKDTADFTTGLKECEQLSFQNRLPLFVLFTGTKSVANGNSSWCPDCVRAEPIINAALDSIDGYVLYECDVDRDPYRSKDYIYRTDPTVKLTCVPTLMKWSNNKCIARLNDNQCQKADLVKELIES